MQTGEVKETIKKDELIISYGNHLVDYYIKDQNYSMISQQLRTLADFLLKIREINDKIEIFSDILQKQNPTIIIETIKKIASYNEETATIEKGNKITMVTALIKKILDFFIDDCIEKGFEDERNKCKKTK